MIDSRMTYMYRYVCHFLVMATFSLASVSGKGYSRNLSCTLNLISTWIMISRASDLYAFLRGCASSNAVTCHQQRIVEKNVDLPIFFRNIW